MLKFCENLNASSLYSKFTGSYEKKWSESYKHAVVFDIGLY